jgi:hypothetical protein
MAGPGVRAAIIPLSVSGGGGFRGITARFKVGWGDQLSTGRSPPSPGVRVEIFMGVRKCPIGKAAFQSYGKCVRAISALCGGGGGREGGTGPELKHWSWSMDNGYGVWSARNMQYGAGAGADL